jgi:hypothetical protein
MYVRIQQAYLKLESDGGWKDAHMCPLLGGQPASAMHVCCAFFFVLPFLFCSVKLEPARLSDDSQLVPQYSQ